MEYQVKRYWKILLLAFAVCIALFSLIYTNKLAQKLADQEKKNTEIWARATNILANSPDYEGDDEAVNDFINEVNNFCLDYVIRKNTTIPVIMASEDGKILNYVNLDSLKLALDKKYPEKKLDEMRQGSDTIVIKVSDTNKQYIYFENSVLLTQLKFFPVYQLGLITLFLLVSYFAFNASRKSEQNRVWVGLAKETAHQLGTPISSLLAWVDIFKSSGGKIEPDLLEEMEKDVNRLELITERFSKIGSEPVLKDENMVNVLDHAVSYLKSRTSEKVTYTIDADKAPDPTAKINIPLFEWVVENLCKNAIDAMDGRGRIDFVLTQGPGKLVIDVKDTGKGIPTSHFKTVFKPGFTTKKRGWGLGLSLVKRIIESYHKGQIFVKDSTLGKGTTFRIVLKK